MKKTTTNRLTKTQKTKVEALPGWQEFCKTVDPLIQAGLDDALIMSLTATEERVLARLLTDKAVRYASNGRLLAVCGVSTLVRADGTGATASVWVGKLCLRFGGYQFDETEDGFITEVREQGHFIVGVRTDPVRFKFVTTTKSQSE